MTDEQYAVTANEPMQRWVDDASSFPLGVPARLRMLIGSGLHEVAGGIFFSAPSEDLVARMPVAELEPFVNRVSLESLPTVARLERGSEPWAYECVAIGLAFARSVLSLAPGFVSIVLDLDQERSSCVVRLTSAPWHPPHPEELAVAVVSRSA